jgi:hypothetical protein
MTDDQELERREKRQLWLSEHGRSAGDIMSDDIGDFILEEVDDEEDVKMRKCYLPQELQTQWIPLNKLAQ